MYSTPPRAKTSVMVASMACSAPASSRVWMRACLRRVASDSITSWNSQLIGVYTALLPRRRILRKARSLHADDAEPLAGRRLHHDPAFEALHDACAEAFE